MNIEIGKLYRIKKQSKHLGTIFITDIEAFPGGKIVHFYPLYDPTYKKEFWYEGLCEKLEEINVPSR